MKNYLIACFACCLLGNTSIAQIKIPQLSPGAVVQQQVGLANVIFSYARPSLRGRKMLGQESIPFGKVWRLGANQVTTIEINDELVIEGKPLPKGKYAMFAIPDSLEWTIVINSDPNQWGAYSYKEEKDVMRFKVKSSQLVQPLETMSMSFEDITPTTASLVFRWEKTQFKISLLHKADEKVMAEIKEKTAKENPGMMTLMESAEYYLLMNRDLEQALTWATQLVEKRKSPFVMNLQAQIAEKLKKYDLAISASNEAIQLATKNGDIAAATAAKDLIKRCEGKK
jgi:Protein of unknown function (DUF2911)